MSADARPGLPRRREPDLGELAAFTVDSAGLVTSWPGSAARRTGQSAEAVVGHGVGDVLLTGPGQQELARRALAEVATGKAWTEMVAGGRLGDGRFTIRWEPLYSPGAYRSASGDAMVTLRRAWPQPSPRWLADAGIAGGGTLDLGQTAAEIAEIAVPAFADAAGVYVAEHMLTADEAAYQRAGHGVAARHLAGRLADGVPANADILIPVGEVIIFDPGTPGFQAMRTGQPVVYDRLDQQSAERASHRRGDSQAAARYTSFLAMPLTAQGTVVGCLMFGRTTASPPFSQNELPHAEELASRAAVRIDNARLYHRERRTAQALQQGLLPRIPDAPPGLEIAGQYLAVGTNVVGGDWQDVIALPGGRAAIVVGDAMGHGPEAAAAMAQLRSAAHVLADLELPPARLLRSLDRMIAEITTSPFATCICAVTGPAAGVAGAGVAGASGADSGDGLEPGSWSCTVSRAGHPPPVVIMPGGKARLLDLPAGLPLGLGEESFEETVIMLPAGATLALYTDGLVENRSRSIDDGLAELCAALSAALAAPDTPLDAACKAVTRGLFKNGEDDITLVLARIRPHPPEEPPSR
jgi:serine phosphatase RsbU (regulator of sigma subunit)